MNAELIAYIKDFVNSYLEGDIDKLVDFDLKKLAKDEVYGCPDRKFDADDCNLMRVIYCLIFGEIWPNLTIDNSGEGKMRGDTMNSSGTFSLTPGRTNSLRNGILLLNCLKRFGRSSPHSILSAT